MKIENRTELKEYRIECQKKQSADCRVLVCGGTGCLASGSGKIYEKLKETDKRSYRGRSKDRGRNRTYKGYEEWMSWLLRDGTSGKN